MQYGGFVKALYASSGSSIVRSWELMYKGLDRQFYESSSSSMTTLGPTLSDSYLSESLRDEEVAVNWFCEL